jgi:hypothetical protein
METYWKQCVGCKNDHRTCDGHYPCSRCATHGVECVRRVRQILTSSIRTKCQLCSKNAHYGIATQPATHCRGHRTQEMIPIGMNMCVYPGCVSTSRTFGFPGQKGTHCKKHALDGMVNVVNKLCDYVGCISTSRSFGYPNSKKRYCKEHALADMANIVNPTCEHPGCSTKSKNFDVPGGKGRFCKAHKLDGMTDVRNQICVETGCNMRANFSIKGSPPRYCSKHKLDGMCNRGACEFGECTIVAGFNYEYGTKGRFCALHKLDGMKNIHVKSCKHAGCTKSASFGEKEKLPTYCSKHKIDGMINLIIKMCEHPGCDIAASYNLPGKRQRFCQKHAAPDMEIVIGKGCQQPECKCRSRCYDFPGGKGRFCARHKQFGMIDVKIARCHECGINARFGIPGSKPTHCSRHRKPGMILRPKARCMVCRKPAYYGKSFIARHCELHKENGDENLMERKCVSCGLLMVLDKDDKCEFCNPTRFETTRLAKQNALMEYLNKHGLRGNSTDVMIERGECGKERPDRVFDFDDKIVILECDEHQHKDRVCTCEQTRMVNIAQSLGGTPTYFIRWNPDMYAPGNERNPEAVTRRHKCVCDYIQNIRDGLIPLPHALLSTIYMYYDGWSGLADATWSVILPFETRPSH